ncbi:MAG: peptidylprolyl isomerase [Pseudomonadota bacterium]
MFSCKKTIFISWIVSTLVSLFAEAKVVESIVAIVNREIVLQSELDERMRPLLPQLEGIPDPLMRRRKTQELSKQFLDRIIDDKLVWQEGRELQLEVTDKELDLAIKDVMHKNNLTQGQLEEALHQEGKTLEAYRETILRPQLMRLRVINIKVRSRVATSDDEVRAQYQKNLRDLGVQTKVSARHIFIHVPDNADRRVVAEKKRFALSLLAKINNGQDFVESAKKHSDDPATRNEGGDLGFFARGTLPPNVEDVVFAMKKDEVKGPIRTSHGFHLIQLVDRQESLARPFEEVKEELYNQIYAEKLEKATRAWLKELRKKAHIEIKL